MRDERGTLFSRAALPGGRQLRLIGMALLLTFLATELGFLQRIFTTTSLTLNQWIACLAISLSLLVVEEAIKFYLAHRGPETAPEESQQLTPQSSPQAA